MPASAASARSELVPAPLVLEGVAEHLGITILALRGSGLSHSLAVARSVAALLLSEHTLLSQVEIGFALGRAKTNTSAGYRLLCAGLKRRGDDQGFAKLVEQARESVLKRSRHV